MNAWVLGKPVRSHFNHPSESSGDLEGGDDRKK